MCKEGKTGICLNVNPSRPGSAYGYVDMGGWVGGQAEYVMVPYADWNLLKFPDKDQAIEKILDLTMLSDIFPTGYHGCVHGRGRPPAPRFTSREPGRWASRPRTPRSCSARRSSIVGDMNEERLKQARELRLRDRRPRRRTPRWPTRSSRSSASRLVDCAVDAVGFEARGHGHDAEEAPATVLNSIMQVTRRGAVSSASWACT